MFITENEQKIIQKLVNIGLTEDLSTVVIHSYFERYLKPIDELPKIICLIAPAILTNEKVESAIDWMVSKKLASKEYRPAISKDVLCISEQFEDTLEEVTGIEGIAEDLKNSRKGNMTKVNINPMGIVGQEENNYAKLLTRLKLAHRTIKYAVLTTDPYDSTADVLETVAKSGVKVQLLIANDDVAMKYKQKHSVASKWKKRFESIENISIKIFNDKSVTDLCTSVLIDDDVLQMVLYDPKRTRSLDGYLIEVVNNSQESINIIRWFKEKFDTAWDNA